MQRKYHALAQQADFVISDRVKFPEHQHKKNIYKSVFKNDH